MQVELLIHDWKASKTESSEPVKNLSGWEGGLAPATAPSKLALASRRLPSPTRLKATENILTRPGNTWMPQLAMRFEAMPTTSLTLTWPHFTAARR